MTQEEILEMQRIAVETDDHDLLCDTYAAQGVSRRYAFVEVSEFERERATAALLAHPRRTRRD